MKKILLIVAMISSVGSGHTQTQWKMATSYEAGGFHDQTNQYFAEQIAIKTNKEIEVSVYPNQVLFMQEQILSATRTNKVQIGEILMSLHGKDYPLWELDSLPFLANSYEQAEKLWEVSRDHIAEDLKKENLTLLYAVPWPGQNFYTQERIDHISYFEGKKMITYNGTLEKVAKMLKATPDRTASRDFAEEFSSGRANTMLISSSSGVENKMWEHSKYYTKVNAFFPKSMVFVNSNQFNKLDEKTQAAIKEAAKSAESHGWALSKQEHFNQEAILVENGMISEEPSKSTRHAIYNIGLKIAVDWHKKADARAKKVLIDFRGF